MNPATYEYTAASIQSLQPGDSNLGCQDDDEGGCARARRPGFLPLSRVSARRSSYTS